MLKKQDFKSVSNSLHKIKIEKNMLKLFKIQFSLNSITKKYAQLPRPALDIHNVCIRCFHVLLQYKSIRFH
jgi:hypothetical protein